MRKKIITIIMITSMLLSSLTFWSPTATGTDTIYSGTSPAADWSPGVTQENQEQPFEIGACKEADQSLTNETTNSAGGTNNQSQYKSPENIVSENVNETGVSEEVGQKVDQEPDDSVGDTDDESQIDNPEDTVGENVNGTVSEPETTVPNPANSETQNKAIMQVNASSTGSNIAQLQSYVNGVVGKRSFSQSDMPALADRYNQEETVDPLSGSLVLKVTDLKLPGRDGLDFVLGRIYNSSQSSIGTRRTLTSATAFEADGQTQYWYPFYVNKDHIPVRGDQAYTTELAAYTAALAKAHEDPNITSAAAVKETTPRGNIVLDVKFHNYVGRRNYLRERYDLGAGWSFAFPSVQIIQEQDEWGSKYSHTYHTGNGTAYDVQITPDDTTDSNLINYPDKDVEFNTCAALNKSYTNGDNVQAQWVFVNSDKSEQYFADDGRLLGIKDRFGNRIDFCYVQRMVTWIDMIDYNNGRPYRVPSYYIKKITDSIGRTITFDYVGDIDSGSINVTVTEPYTNKTMTVSYIKQPYNYEYYAPNLRLDINLGGGYYLYPNAPYIGEARVEPLLFQVINPENQVTEYHYDMVPTWFNYSSPVSSYSAGNNEEWSDTMCLLSQIKYPHSTTHYQYQNVVRYMGTKFGQYKESVVSKRYDAEFIGDTNTEGPQRNVVSYSRDRDYTYKYVTGGSDYLWQQSVKQGGLTIKETYFQDGRPYETVISGDGKTKTIKVNNWHPTFWLKPTQITTTEKDSTGTSSVVYQCDYNTWGKLAWEQVGDSNHRVTYEYNDPNDKLLLTGKQWFQKLGQSLRETYKYYSNGRLQQTIDAKNQTTDYYYTPGIQAPVTEMKSVITMEDGTTTETITAYGAETDYAVPRQIKTIYTENGVRKETKVDRTYNMLLGLVETETDNAGYQTVYNYDKLGRTTYVRLPDVNNAIVETITTYTPRSTSSQFDTYNSGLLTTLVEAYTRYTSGGQTKVYNHRNTYYNAYGQPVLDTIYNPDSGTWVPQAQFHYDNNMRVIYAVDALGNQEQYQYDAWDNCTRIIDAFGIHYVTQLNPGERSQYTYVSPGGSGREHEIRQYFDQWGHLTRKVAQQENITESYDYDCAGNIISQTSPKNYTWVYNYDALDRLQTITDPLGQTATYQYDRQGNLKSTTISGSGQSWTTQKFYNGLGQIVQNKDPYGYQDTFQYNNRSLLEQATDPNGTTFSYTYDSHKRILSRDSSQGSSYTYQYYPNPFGLDTVTTNDGRSIKYTYDGLGRTTSVTIAGNGANNTITYGNYDLLNRAKDITDPNGVTTHYEYDKTRVSTVTADGKTVTYAYYSDGNLKSITYPGGSVRTEYTYDNLDRVRSVTNYRNQEVLSRYEYDYDNNGNITTVSEQLGSEPPRISNYQYDELDRLKTISRPNGRTLTYKYNARGDRTVAEGFVPQLDKTDADYTFNEWNQLTQVVRNGETITFQYDANGLRSQKTWSAGTRRYIYEPGGRLLAEKDASNQMLASYIWGPDRLLFRKNADDQVYYYLYNGHGDVVQIVDAAGSIVNQYRYDEWGRITEQTETVSNEFKYAGETYDAETGLYYLRARYYDPDTGRFISKDSMEGDLWNPLSQNLYTYCENNPIVYVDPSGQYMVGDALLGMSKADWNAIGRLGEQWQAAKKAGNTALMQLYHDQANEIRFKYTEVVTRINYSTGKSEIIGRGVHCPVDPIPTDLIAGLLSGPLYGITKAAISSGSKIVISQGAGNLGKPLYRYMSEGELQAVKETGVLRGGRPGTTFWTDARMKSAEKATDRLSLPETPQYRVEFRITNSPTIEGGTKVRPQFGRRGGGREYWSNDPVEVDIINAQPIGPR